MGTAVRPVKTSPRPWDVFADVEVYVDEVLAEFEARAKQGARTMRSAPKPPLARAAIAAAALRNVVMAIWWFIFVACSGGRSDCCAIFPSACFVGCSPA
jgi:hypothetical protein